MLILRPPFSTFGTIFVVRKMEPGRGRDNGRGDTGPGRRRSGVVAKVLFWSCLLLITHSYVLYPLILLVVSRFSRSSATPAAVPDHTPDEMLPHVTMLFAAHNEARVIQEKVQNCLALDYPADKLRVVIASDGSEDGTNEIVAACKDPRIQLVAYPQRR